MGLNEKLDSLFKRYKKEYYVGKSFFPDGIIDEERYLALRPRVLYLLKDPNADDSEEDNLREWVRDFAEEFVESGKLYLTWKNAGRLAYLIHKGLPDYSALSYASRRDIADSILSLAVVNLKKSGGRGVSDRNILWDTAERDFSLWKEEIDIINPDIAICGGTYGIVSDIFLDNGIIYEDMLMETPIGMPYFIYKGRTFIDFLHPLLRGLRLPVAYSYLREGLRHILKMDDTD